MVVLAGSVLMIVSDLDGVMVVVLALLSVSFGGVVLC